MSKDAPPEKFREWLLDRGVSDEAIERIFPRSAYFNIARMLPYGEDWIAFMNSVGMGCLRGRVDNFMVGEDWTECYSAVTGFETSLKELRTAAKRIYSLYKALNVRVGFSRKDDAFPERWFEPLETSDREELLDDYYDERGWDIETGIPEKRTLLELGLEDVAGDLENRGLLGKE
jgi:aldehyde:ferredoxin oxidoreductase